MPVRKHSYQWENDVNVDSIRRSASYWQLPAVEACDDPGRANGSSYGCDRIIGTCTHLLCDLSTAPITQYPFVLLRAGPPPSGPSRIVFVVRVVVRVANGRMSQPPENCSIHPTHTSHLIPACFSHDNVHWRQFLAAD